MSDKKGLSLAELERQVAQQMIDLMQRDGLRWVKGWATPLPTQNFETGHVYRGTNVLTTGIAMLRRGLRDPRFITFKQARSLGGNIRKGSKGVPIIFYGTSTAKDAGEEERRFRFARITHVFSVTDVEGVDIPPLPEPDQRARQRNERIDAFVAGAGARVKPAPSAFYSEQDDAIGMPDLSLFLDGQGISAEERYYSTLLHELIHFTGPKTRLDRECFRLYRARNTERAKEELIAEIGAVMLGQRLGLQTEPAEENAAYVQSWIELLTDKPAAIFEAASAAARAIDFLETSQSAQEAQAA